MLKLDSISCFKKSRTKYNTTCFYSIYTNIKKIIKWDDLFIFIIQKLKIKKKQGWRRWVCRVCSCTFLFGRSVNPIPTRRGDRLCPSHDQSHTQFDLSPPPLSVVYICKNVHIAVMKCIQQFCNLIYTQNCRQDLLCLFA